MRGIENLLDNKELYPDIIETRAVDDSLIIAQSDFDANLNPIEGHYYEYALGAKRRKFFRKLLLDSIDNMIIVPTNDIEIIDENSLLTVAIYISDTFKELSKKLRYSTYLGKASFNVSKMPGNISSYKRFLSVGSIIDALPNFYNECQNSSILELDSNFSQTTYHIWQDSAYDPYIIFHILIQQENVDIK